VPFKDGNNGLKFDFMNSQSHETNLILRQNISSSNVHLPNWLGVSNINNGPQRSADPDL